MHPEALAESARLLMEAGRYDTPAYRTLQLEGSSWDRGTVYGARVVEFAKEFAPYLAGTASARICCAGCASGLEMELFRKLDFQVEGFDLDPERVRVAEYCGLKAKVGDIHDPPYSDATYDAVFCSHTLEHSVDRDRACQKLGALLKPRGLLCLIVPLEPEFPRLNPSHTAWVREADDVLKNFMGWELLKRREHVDTERQVILVLRKPDGER